VKQFVAEHVTTPMETLVELSQDSDLAYWIAGNPKTPVEMLTNFSKHESENVRASVAVNPSTPVETLDSLMIDENEDVRAAVMKNPVIKAKTSK
jgi:pentose-5-phosphate-3-epimerase